MICQETSPGPGWKQHGDSILWQCAAMGLRTHLPCPAGRPEAVGRAFCAAHGGNKRSHENAAAQWNYLAPASVGDSDAVRIAGNTGLMSTEFYVIVRPERDRWLAWLGIGSMLIGVPNPLGMTSRQKRQTRRKAELNCDAAYGFSSCEEAVAAGTSASVQRCAQVVADITAARGGTLSWGIAAVAPASAPIVLLPGEHGSAWDLLSPP